MLVYILGITKRGNKGITDLGRLYRLQVRATGITNRRSLKDFKLRKKRLQIGSVVLNQGKEISNRGKRD